MKLNYHTYSLEHDSNKQHFIMDMRPFFKAFCDYDNPAFKNKFLHNDENVYLLSAGLNLYLFLTTRSHEIIKTIRSTDLEVDEIYDLLDKDESLGFASYIYVDKYYFGFASTMMAPKSKSFVDFVNDIFTEIGIDDYWFVTHPIMHESTKAEALKMGFIGRSVITVNSENDAFNHLRKMVGGTTEEFSDIDSFDITIKPRTRRNIKSAVQKFINKVPSNGLDKMLIRAKEELQGSLIDLYIAGSGGVADIIKTRDERFLHDEIIGKIKANAVLSEKVKEYESDEKYTKNKVASITDLHSVDTWHSRVSDI